MYTKSNNIARRDGKEAGRKKWIPSSVRRILTNEKYIGDALLQKTYTIDFLNKKG